MKYPPPFKLFKRKHGQTNVNKFSIAIYPGKAMGVVHVKSPSKKAENVAYWSCYHFSTLKYLTSRWGKQFHSMFACHVLGKENDTPSRSSLLKESILWRKGFPRFQVYLKYFFHADFCLFCFVFCLFCFLMFFEDIVHKTAWQHLSRILTIT